MFPLYFSLGSKRNLIGLKIENCPFGCNNVIVFIVFISHVWSDKIVNLCLFYFGNFPTLLTRVKKLPRAYTGHSNIYCITFCVIN